MRDILQKSGLGEDDEANSHLRSLNAVINNLRKAEDINTIKSLAKQGKEDIEFLYRFAKKEVPEGLAKLDRLIR